ncbi:MAG TPA: BRCT domain-containing protein [Chitinophagaceae bacterium]|nr:BRCT domain-containing protein [Chitinophagaceae bacterium]
MDKEEFINQLFDDAYDHKKIDSSILKQDLEGVPIDNPFYNKKIVFTGDMINWPREKAATVLQKLGADVNTSISRRTNIIIIGEEPGPAKALKVIKLLADGAEIKLMNEKIFEELVKVYLDK